MKLLILAALLALSACSSDSESNTETCAPGLILNPISGECVPPGNANNENNANNANNANNVNNANNANNANNTNNTNNLQPDLGSDMNGVADMPDEKDMAADMPPQGPFRRFVAIGDVGTGSPTQIKVGQSIGTVCNALGGCDFGLLLGDNVYDSGVDSVNDARFTNFFVVPYGHLSFPFYVVLGNHDLGGDGLGLDLDFNKANYQIDYSQQNQQWKMPARHYQVDQDALWLVGLNTTDVFFDQADNQKADVLNWLSNAPNDRWKIAFGHHPYISNGRHGNAGEYEGLPFVPIANGQAVKEFMDDTVCGKFDMYICGHDHNRQDLVATCGTEFIVSGAGAKTTDLEGRGNTAHFERDTEGFLLIEATRTTLKVQFYDEDGVLEHTRMLTR